MYMYRARPKSMIPNVRSKRTGAMIANSVKPCDL
jgi:hypothetical protein